MKKEWSLRDGEAILSMRQFFSKMIDAKLKADIPIGTQIRKLSQSEAFELTMTVVEKSSQHGFRNVVNGFLGNHRKEKTLI